jgi:hypothetical protein
MRSNVADILRELFEHAKHTLPVETLEQLGNVESYTELEVDHVADTLEYLSTAIIGDDRHARPTESQLSSILWGLSQKTKVVSTMIHIQSEAAFLAEKRKAEVSETSKTASA